MSYAGVGVSVDNAHAPVPPAINLLAVLSLLTTGDR